MKPINKDWSLEQLTGEIEIEFGGQTFRSHGTVTFARPDPEPIAKLGKNHTFTVGGVLKSADSPDSRRCPS